MPQGAYADYANEFRTGRYAMLSVSAAVAVNKKVELFIDARNLTGKKAVGDISAVTKYVFDNPATANDESSVIFYPVERRAVYAGLRARL